mmetsp:Transcript_29810/g.46741  ORF Transcript_29810/g.46741 Transcript_29810/m.46741 type:complete len:212 (-) Transcript_29810:250-885(-)
MNCLALIRCVEEEEGVVVVVVAASVVSSVKSKSSGSSSSSSSSSVLSAVLSPSSLSSSTFSSSLQPPLFTPPPKLNHKAITSPGLILTYSSLITSILPKVAYIPTHCCNGPKRVSIFFNACNNCGFSNTSSWDRNLVIAAVRSACPSGMPWRARAPCSSLERAVTASIRFGCCPVIPPPAEVEEEESSLGIELMVSSQLEAAASIDRVVVN